MYDVMRVWDTLELDDLPLHIADFARIWRETDKIVYSTTLDHLAAPRTRLERDFAVDAIRRLKEEPQSDLAVGGASLAARAFEAGLVDVVQLFLSPIIVGGGTRCLPSGVRARLELEDERRFANGVVYVRYRHGRS
jgi:dihydrofolate reductase